MNCMRLLNNNILRAARNEPVDRIPVWIDIANKQAQHFLPGFSELLDEYLHSDLFLNPKLACTLALIPLKYFDLDAVKMYESVFTIPEALGMQIDKQQAKLTSPLTSPADVTTLNVDFDMSVKLRHVFDAIGLTRVELNGQVPLITSVHAPWTLMSVMIEGQESETETWKAKTWLYKWPGDSHNLLKLLTSLIVDYLVEQVRAGAQLLQLIDNRASCLDFEKFVEFSLPYLYTIPGRLRESLRKHSLTCVPMIISANDNHFSCELLARLNYQVVNVDLKMKPRRIREICGDAASLQWDFDACILHSSQKDISDITEQKISSFGTKGLIVQIDGGNADIDPNNLTFFIDCVHSYGR
jgi:uroporphyrinogen decarboxylase